MKRKEERFINLALKFSKEIKSITQIQEAKSCKNVKSLKQTISRSIEDGLKATQFTIRKEAKFENTIQEIFRKKLVKAHWNFKKEKTVKVILENKKVNENKFMERRVSLKEQEIYKNRSNKEGEGNSKNIEILENTGKGKRE